MNWFDLAALGFLVMCAGTGAWKGLSKSGFGLLATGFAFAGAVWLWPDSMWGFWITFALIVTASAVAAKLLGKWCKLTGSSWVDHLLGGHLGWPTERCAACSPCSPCWPSRPNLCGSR